jgi:hypothetical protein
VWQAHPRVLAGPPYANLSITSGSLVHLWITFISHNSRGYGAVSSEEVFGTEMVPKLIMDGTKILSMTGEPPLSGLT